MRNILINFSLFILSFICVTNSFGADINRQELLLLEDELRNTGYAHIQINLNHAVSFAELVKNKESSIEKIKTIEDKILIDLGESIVQSAIWRNGLGQIGVVASPEGLKRISNSPLIASYGRDDTWISRSSAYFSEGQLEKIQTKIQNAGQANIEVLINLNEIEFEIQKNGKSLAKVDEKKINLIKIEAQKFHKSLESAGYLNIDGIRSGSNLQSLRQSFSVNQQDFFKLMARADLRSIRLHDESEVVLLPLPQEIFDHAQKYGAVSVVIDLQRYVGYSPRRDVLDDNAWNAQTRTIKKSFDDIFAKLGISDKSSIRIFDGIASASVTLPKAAVDLLFQSRDPRIRSVLLSKPMAEVSLLQSIPAINMTQAISKGLDGTGQ